MALVDTFLSILAMVIGVEEPLQLLVNNFNKSYLGFEGSVLAISKICGCSMSNGDNFYFASHWLAN